MAIRQRFRIRFRKAGDLRLISHRDLIRMWERLFRRAALPLSMSEGFHPKPRMNFPSALGLGIEGAREVLEVELSEALSADEVLARVTDHCPPGLEIVGVESLGGGRPGTLRSATYELSLPGEREAEAHAAVARLVSQPEIPIVREGRAEPIDLRAGLELLEIDAGRLRMRLAASRTASARPGDVLEALGLADLSPGGLGLVRVEVELEETRGTPPRTDHTVAASPEEQTSHEPPRESAGERDHGAAATATSDEQPQG